MRTDHGILSVIASAHLVVTSFRTGARVQYSVTISGCVAYAMFLIAWIPTLTHELTTWTIGWPVMGLISLALLTALCGHARSDD